MPGREEALERARLARLRQEFNVDRTDHGLFRDAADQVFKVVAPPGADEEASTALSSGFAGALTGLIAPAVGVAGAMTNSGDERNAKGYGEFKRNALANQLPDLDPAFYESTEFGGEPRLRQGPSRGGGPEQRLLDSLVPAKGRFALDAALPDSAFGNYGLSGDQADQSVTGINWDATAKRLGRSMPNRAVSVTNVPEFGPDLGGFSRGWQPDPENITALTVVPDANSGRFSQALLPPLIDQVYGKDALFHMDGKIHNGLPAGERREIRPVPRDRLAGLSPYERVDLLSSLAPGQTSGRNQSGYIWGTSTESPRYEYAAGSKGNPEVVVSEVRTPPELQIRYLYTPDAKDPYVRYWSNLGISAEPEVWMDKAVGPAWGVSEQEVTPGMTLSGRRKRNTAGDISFRSDLIERRGGFSLADAQAVQARLGLPIVAAADVSDSASINGSTPRLGRGRTIQVAPELALQNAVASIAKKEGLSEGEVVERYARRLPRLGSTTSPRQPAEVRVSEMPVDIRPGVTSGLRRAFDLPEALRQAGQEPTVGGLKAVNEAADAFAAGKVRAMRNVKFGAPGAGALLGLADPQAAELLGTALRQESPTMRLGLARDAVRVMGQNTLVGAVQGLGISGVMAAAPYLGLAAPAAAAATGLAIAAPTLAGAAVVNTADSYLKGATGEGLKQHWQKAQQQWQPSGMQATQQLFPRPKPVTARTPSGVAQLRPAPRSNPAVQEARNRVALFRENFNPLRGDFGVTELFFGRGGARR